MGHRGASCPGLLSFLPALLQITSPADRRRPRSTTKASPSMFGSGRHKESTIFHRLLHGSPPGVYPDSSVSSDCSPPSGHRSDFCLILHLPFPNLYFPNSSHNHMWSNSHDEFLIPKQTDTWNTKTFWSKFYFLWAKRFWLNLKKEFPLSWVPATGSTLTTDLAHLPLCCHYSILWHK